MAAGDLSLRNSYRVTSKQMFSRLDYNLCKALKLILRPSFFKGTEVSLSSSRTERNLQEFSGDTTSKW